MFFSSSSKASRRPSICWRRAFCMTGLGLAALLGGSAVLAAGTVTDLSGVATNIKKNVQSLGTMIVIISYVAGLGFALAGILQFKQYKENSSQTPLGKPVMALFIGVGLLFLPTLLKSAGKTVFGTEDQESAATSADAFEKSS